MMSEQVSSYPSDGRHSWKEPVKLSFADFNLLVRQHVAEIVQNQEYLQRARALFRSRGDISSDETDLLLVSLQAISNTICSFNRILEDPITLPSVVRPLCYPLVAKLFASEKLIKRTEQRVKAFRSSGRIISTAVIKQHYSIIHILEELLDVCEETKLSARSVLDQARFQISRQMR